MTANDAQQCIRMQLNTLRALDRLVNTIGFVECLKLDPNNPRLKSALDAADLDAVRDWVDEVISNELCDKSIKQLRALAGQLGLKYYTGLSKDELLVQIVQVKTNALRRAENDAGRVSHEANGTQTIPG